MKVHKIDMGETKLFSPLFLDFLNQKDTLKPFYSLFPSKQNFMLQIDAKQKQFTTEAREVLIASLRRQYEGVEISDRVEQNIGSLQSPNAFTVTTGHQLNIFTGPLYFIYKIVTVINACKELQSDYPDYNFVPVYWMASEDHDFEEISYINLFSEKYTWISDQKGAVGRFDPSSLKTVLQSMPGPNKVFEKAYLEHSTLAAAVRYYVNEIFGEDGIVVVDGDDRDLKSRFSSITKDELLNQISSKTVGEDSSELTELGYKPQISSREINLFYLEDGIRERIVKDEKGYRVLNLDIKFTEDEIVDLVDNEPQKFSPNVILRPLYQEVVLPNLAYVGGPAEVVYWLQLKRMFGHYQIPYPILLPRNFALFMDASTRRKFDKTGIEVKELFEPLKKLVEKHVRESSKNELELSTEMETVQKLFEGVQKKAIEIDVTLEQFVGAESKRALNSLEKIEQKIMKAEKRHYEDHIRQLEDIKERLFPGGGPQERTLNYLNFQLGDDQFIHKIKSSLSPFDLNYHVITDGD